MAFESRIDTCERDLNQADINAKKLLKVVTLPPSQRDSAHGSRGAQSHRSDRLERPEL